MRMLAPMRSGVIRKRFARTGPPAIASTTLMPTVRSIVLLPDMFEPLTSNARAGPEISTSLHTRTAAGIKGWPRSTA